MYIHSQHAKGAFIIVPYIVYTHVLKANFCKHSSVVLLHVPHSCLFTGFPSRQTYINHLIPSHPGKFANSNEWSICRCAAQEIKTTLEIWSTLQQFSLALRSVRIRKYVEEWIPGTRAHFPIRFSDMIYNGFRYYIANLNVQEFMDGWSI